MSLRQAFILLCFTVTAAFFAWATLARVDVIVRTSGQIIPAGKSQVVQHLEGGIVRRILVHEGELLTRGQALFELSDVQIRSDLDRDQSRLDALRAREARLLAEVRGLDEPIFPAELQGADVIGPESQAWRDRRDRLKEEVAVLEAQREQRQRELDEIKVRRRSLGEELDLALRKQQVIEKLHRDHAASELELIDIRMRLQQLRTELTEADSRIPRLEAGVAEAAARIKEAEARFRADASGELTRIRQEIAALEQGLKGNEDRLRRVVVRSPVAGRVNRVNVTTLGAVVRPGEILCEITPSGRGILIETAANPDDRAHLRPGLRAHVRVGAYDYATYGSFAGEVTEVSADTLADSQGRHFYRVTIAVSASELETASDIPGPLLPGMRASADITVGRRTILSFLLSPLMRFRDGVFRAG